MLTYTGCMLGRMRYNVGYKQGWMRYSVVYKLGRIRYLRKDEVLCRI